MKNSILLSIKNFISGPFCSILFLLFPVITGKINYNPLHFSALQNINFPCYSCYFPVISLLLPLLFPCYFSSFFMAKYISIFNFAEWKILKIGAIHIKHILAFIIFNSNDSQT